MFFVGSVRFVGAKSVPMFGGGYAVNGYSVWSIASCSGISYVMSFSELGLVFFCYVSRVQSCW